MRVVLYCEADADARTATTLIEECLCYRVDWLREHRGTDTWSDVAVRYEPDEAAGGRGWFNVHEVEKHRDRLGIKPSRGHFDGRPASPGAHLLANLGRIVRRLRQRAGGDSAAEAVVLVWDMDKQGKERTAGLTQARDAMGAPTDFAVVIGRPDPMRETWILAGFSPSSEEERRRLDAERALLGFAPNEQPHRLTATGDTDRKHPKRVLKSLLGGVDAEREAACLRIDSTQRWELLHTRGGGCGLAAFLEEIDTRLVPRVGGASPAPGR